MYGRYGQPQAQAAMRTAGPRSQAPPRAPLLTVANVKAAGRVAAPIAVASGAALSQLPAPQAQAVGAGLLVGGAVGGALVEAIPDDLDTGTALAAGKQAALTQAESQGQAALTSAASSGGNTGAAVQGLVAAQSAVAQQQ